MDIDELRLRRFRALWQDRFGGNIAALARALHRSPNQVRFYLHPEKPGGRWMGEEFARHVERELGLPQNSMDTDVSSMPPEQDALNAAWRELPPTGRVELATYAEFLKTKYARLAAETADFAGAPERLPQPATAGDPAATPGGYRKLTRALKAHDRKAR